MIEPLLPVKLTLTEGQKIAIASAVELIPDSPKGAILLAGKGYAVNALRHPIKAGFLTK